MVSELDASIIEELGVIHAERVKLLAEIQKAAEEFQKIADEYRRLDERWGVLLAFLPDGRADQ